MPPIVLYQPTSTEITTLIESGKRKHPAVAFLYDDASKLLHNGALGFAFDLWHCLSQSDPHQVYQLYNGQCTCPAYQKALYRLSDHTYCKHNIAYFALQHILVEHFSRRWLGSNLSAQVVQSLRSQPHTWLAQNSHTPGFHSHDGNQGYFVCYALPIPAKADQGDQTPLQWAPANPTQLARFSAWLATAVHPLPVAGISVPAAADQPAQRVTV